MNKNNKKPSPSSPALVVPYSEKTIQQKKKNKFSFLRSHHIAPETFTILIATKNVTKQQELVIKELVEGLHSLQGVRCILWGEVLSSLKKELYICEKDIEQALAIGDVMLYFPEQISGNISLVITALEFGCVPIAPIMEKNKNLLIPFNPLEEKGNAFLYHSPTLWQIFEAVVKAKENYNFPYDWENIIKKCMQS